MLLPSRTILLDRRGRSIIRPPKPAVIRAASGSSAPGLVRWKLDAAAGRITFASDLCAILSCYDPTKCKETRAISLDRLHQSDADYFRQVCHDCLAGRAAVAEAPVRLRCDTGGWIWLLMRGVKMPVRGGKSACIAGTTVDVTRLHMNKRFVPCGEAPAYEAMLENSPDVILRYDRALFPLYANPTLAEYFTYNPETLGCTPMAELNIAKDAREFIISNVREVFETGRARYGRHSMLTLKGRCTGDFRFWPEFGRDGQAASVLMQVRDITETMHREEEARLAARRFSALYRLTQMDDTTEEELIRFVVEQADALTGSRFAFLHIARCWPRGEGRTFWSNSHLELVDSLSYLPHSDIPPNIKAALEKSVDVPPRPGMRNSPDGNPLFVTTNAKIPVTRYLYVPISEAGQLVCIAGVCNKERDYDEADLREFELFMRGAWLRLRRFQAMQDLRLAKESAEKANRFKDEFLANVSHELRTPLNGVLSMLQLLEMSTLSANQAEYVQTAHSSGKALLRIISDILDYSRIESGRMDLRFSPFDIEATLEATIHLFAGEAEKRGLKLSLNKDRALPRTLVGDDARIRQILFNLVGNAFKFTEKGEVEVECRLLPARPQGRICLYFAVRDSGIGMAEESHGLIFKPFTQLDNSDTRQYAGTGLGLGIVARLIQMMNGSLCVDSELGRGTTVHFSLPLDDGAACPGVLEASGAGRSKEEQEPLNILVAEDDQTSRFAMSTLLRRIGHRAFCVNNGREALEALSLYPFDCLVTDIQMPVLDGALAVRHIRDGKCGGFKASSELTARMRTFFCQDSLDKAEVPKDLMVIAVSAHAMSGDRERFLHQGMDLYLSKPVIFSELQAVLKEVQRRKRLE